MKLYRFRHVVIYETDRRQMTDETLQTEFRNYRQTEILVLIYGPFRPVGPFFGSSKNSRNIGLLER